jgi:predicted nucleic acid-binding protein
VETAAVARRLAGRILAARASKGILKSYNLADEEAIFDVAWDVALETGCSGFDSYFIALARREDAILFTDDFGIHQHANEFDVNSILIRNHDINTLKDELE